jgi:hypothetical protein
MIDKTKKHARDHRYDASEKGRERRRRYNQSRKGRERNQRYEQSEKGRETRWQWSSDNSFYLARYREWRHQCEISEGRVAEGRSPLRHLKRPDPPSAFRDMMRRLPARGVFGRRRAAPLIAPPAAPPDVYGR